MNSQNSNWKITESHQWKFNEILMGRAVSSYTDLNEVFHSSNKKDTVRLHMGIRGDYSFTFKQLGQKYDLIGGHHNIMYSNGLDLEICNKSLEIETFGVEFPKEVFISLGQDGDEMMKRFCDQLLSGTPIIIAEKWGSINVPIQSIINEISLNPYQGNLQQIFLYAKTLELLVLCIANYKNKMEESYNYLKTIQDKEAIIAARDFINQRLTDPPNLSEIAREVGVNEFKLKYGFKEMFGVTLFAYLTENRLSLATQYLRDSSKPIAVIAEELGYSSPQHFSNQYKGKLGVSPSEVRLGAK